jgi:hypothetical protein
VKREAWRLGEPSELRDWELRAGVWDESKHPRDPGGEGGGQFIEKGTSAAAGGSARSPSGRKFGTTPKLAEATIEQIRQEAAAALASVDVDKVAPRAKQELLADIEALATIRQRSFSSEAKRRTERNRLLRSIANGIRFIEVRNRVGKT